MYDLIVIGDDLSSHLSAAYASQNGLNTLLIAEGGLGGLQLIGDFIFNIDPTPLSGLGPDQPGRAVLAELGIAIPESETPSINPGYQIILPDHRIDFYNDLDSLTAELAREFPELDGEISDYYRLTFEASAIFSDWIAEHSRIQPQNLKEYFSYLKIYPHIFKYKYGAVKFDKILSQDASLEKVWEAQQALLSGNLDDLFSFASAFQYCTPLRGVSYFQQGKQFLFNALVEKLESNKGSYLSNHQILSVTRNRTIELEIKAPDGTTSKVSGLNLIVSTKSDKLPLLRGNHKHINFSDWVRPARIAYYPFTIFLGVADKCLPEQIARHIAVVPDTTKDLYDNNLIILDTSIPEKEKPLSQARTSLAATVYLPEAEENWTWDALKREANSILDRLEGFLPFLKENIELSNVDKSIDISLSYRKVLSPKYKVRNAFFTSFAAKSNKTRFNNVFLTGGSLLTDAGFDAEILSGRNAALQVMNRRK
jgi:phytoene dehydrogenase-like protein